jgi:hypothetical protein
MARINEKRLGELLRDIEAALRVAWEESRNNTVTTILEKQRHRLIMIIAAINYIERLKENSESEYSGDESYAEDSD